MHILAGIFLQNLSQSDGNILRLAHRGNAALHEVRSWPTPSHPDELLIDRKQQMPESNLLTVMYGNAFSDINGQLYQDKALIAWDQWIQMQSRSAIDQFIMSDRLKRETWEPRVPFSNETLIAPINHNTPRNEYAPFTTWEIGPFPAGVKTYALTYSIRIAGESYDWLTSSSRP